jgi:hypothetical protein
METGGTSAGGGRCPQGGGSRGRRPEMRLRPPGLRSKGPIGSRIQQAPSADYGAIGAVE